jgi:hypothetical protein
MVGGLLRRIDDTRFPGWCRVETPRECRRMSQGTTEPTEEATTDEHLADVEDGCGCAEVWEHLSERREADD